jgi:hypothetical protein
MPSKQTNINVEFPQFIEPAIAGWVYDNYIDGLTVEEIMWKAELVWAGVSLPVADINAIIDWYNLLFV